MRTFTGKMQDIDATYSGGQYDFPEREYNSIQGRWWTPDPSGLTAVNPNDPQSWDRYAYVEGAPIESTDPLGLCHIDQHQHAVDDNGGSCIQSPITTVTISDNCLELWACELPYPLDPSKATSNDPWLPWNRGRSEGGGGPQSPTPTPSVPPRSQPATLTRPAWLNLISSVFGYDQNNPLPSCLGDVFARTVADDLNPFEPSVGDVTKAAIGVGAAVQFNRALDYAAGRGLTSPFQSSIFRSLVGSSGRLQVWAEDAPAFGVIVSLLHGLSREIHALNEGACQ